MSERSYLNRVDVLPLSVRWRPGSGWSSEWWSARYSSMGRPWRIDLTTHRTMSEHSYHGATEWMRYLWVCDDGLVAGGHLSDGVRDIAQWVDHEGSIQQPFTPWANTLTTELQDRVDALPLSARWRPGSGWSSEWWSARYSSMGPPWRIDPTTHRTMSERSYHGITEWMRYLWVCDDGLVAGGHLSDGEQDIAQWVDHEGSIRRPIAPWANTLTTELRSGCITFECAMTAW